MELSEVKSIKLDLGDGKYVKLNQTFSILETIGVQGGLLSGPKNEHFIFIPSGALLSDTNIEATVYHVIDSVGLDRAEYVTSMLEITPHELKFEKPIEILMCHGLFIDGDSSKVTLFYHSGPSTDDSFTPSCQLTSVNESCLANDMTMTLWEDFVHIETSHFCRFDVLCEGTSFIKFWASLYTPKIPNPKQLCIKLSLGNSKPKPNFKIIEVAGFELECRCCTQLTLTRKDKENLQVTVEIPSGTKGWRPRTDSDSSRTILYKDIQNLVVQDRPDFSTDFDFEKTGDVNATEFDPIFVFNHVRCVLSPSSTFRQTFDTVSTCSEENSFTGNFFTYYVVVTFVVRKCYN